MHSHARSNAKAAGELLLYIPAVDLLVARMVRVAYDEMRAVLNVSATAELLGSTPLCDGVEVIFTESYSLPKVARRASADVVGIEFQTAGRLWLDWVLARWSRLRRHGGVVPHVAAVRVDA